MATDAQIDRALDAFVASCNSNAAEAHEPTHTLEEVQGYMGPERWPWVREAFGAAIDAVLDGEAHG